MRTRYKERLSGRVVYGASLRHWSLRRRGFKSRLSHTRTRTAKEKKYFFCSTPTGFEPVRAEPNSLAGYRLNHSAKVSLCSACKNIFFCTPSATGNRTPGICVTGRDVTNYTIADPHDDVLWEEKNIFCRLSPAAVCVRERKKKNIFFLPLLQP